MACAARLVERHRAEQQRRRRVDHGGRERRPRVRPPAGRSGALEEHVQPRRGRAAARALRRRYKGGPAVGVAEARREAEPRLRAANVARSLSSSRAGRPHGQRLSGSAALGAYRWRPFGGCPVVHDAAVPAPPRGARTRSAACPSRRRQPSTAPGSAKRGNGLLGGTSRGLHAAEDARRGAEEQAEPWEPPRPGGLMRGRGAAAALSTSSAVRRARRTCGCGSQSACLRGAAERAISSEAWTPVATPSSINCAKAAAGKARQQLAPRPPEPPDCAHSLACRERSGSRTLSQQLAGPAKSRSGRSPR